MNSQNHTAPRWSDIRNYTLIVIFVMVLGPFAFVPVGSGDLLYHRNPLVFWGRMIIIASWIFMMIRNLKIKDGVVSIISMLILACLILTNQNKDGIPLFLVIILASHLFFAMRNSDR